MRAIIQKVSPTYHLRAAKNNAPQAPGVSPIAPHRMGARAGTRAGIGIGTRVGIGAGARIGTRVGARAGIGAGTRVGARAGTRAGIGIGTRVGIGAGAFGLGIVSFLLAVVCLAATTPKLAAAEDLGENVVNPQQLPDSSFIYDTGIVELAAADAYFDNQTVQITGEAVGDLIKIIEDPSHRWVEVASKSAKTNASISVFMTDESASLIDTFGKYKATGTLLQVRGIYHLACPQHEGLSDLHAEHVTVVERGKQHPETFDAQAYIPGVAVVVIGLGLLLVFYRLRERQR